jgi:hypothetical protein
MGQTSVLRLARQAAESIQTCRTRSHVGATVVRLDAVSTSAIGTCCPTYDQQRAADQGPWENTVRQPKLRVYRRADLLMNAPVFLLTVTGAISDNVTAGTLHQLLHCFFFCPTTSTLFFLHLGCRGTPIFLELGEGLLFRLVYLFTKKLHSFKQFQCCMWQLHRHELEKARQVRIVAIRKTMQQLIRRYHRFSNE